MLRLLVLALFFVIPLPAQTTSSPVIAPFVGSLTGPNVLDHIGRNAPPDVLNGAPLHLALKHAAVEPFLTPKTRRVLIDYVVAQKFKSLQHNGKNLSFSHAPGYAYWPNPKPAQRYYTVTTSDINKVIANLRPYEKLLGFAPQTSLLKHTNLDQNGHPDEVNMTITAQTYILIIENVLEVQATVDALNKLQAETVLEK